MEFISIHTYNTTTICNDIKMLVLLPWKLMLHNICNMGRSDLPDMSAL